MPTPAPSGVLLCGVVASFNSIPIVMITGVSNVGMTRKHMDNIHNDVAGGVADALFSCIRLNKPIRISGVCDTNSAVWLSQMALTNSINTPFSITWPPEEGYTTGGSIAWTRSGLVDVSYGSPDIEGRINVEFTVQPAKLPTITAGTPVV